MFCINEVIIGSGFRVQRFKGSELSAAAGQTNRQSNRNRNFAKFAKDHISASDVSYSFSSSSSRLLNRIQFRL
ncbi:hypothetical protein D1AOALGA4SA_13151 [Olavius algarvensis Delta 1 endosymbiont]|nr:hypothetical protein D1AOALGA4SA_13151 [Olavius algarvensis Delta 1 endosymbiont]